jgi:hypothetical protein
VPRIRRPLIALVVLLAALLIGYVVNAVRDDHHAPNPTTSISPTSPSPSPASS